MWCRAGRRSCPATRCVRTGRSGSATPACRSELRGLGVGRFILRRLVQSAVVLLGVTLVVFLLLQLVPGDPVRIALGTRYDQGTYDALRARSGLDRPLVVQYLSYVGHALTGDLGVSFRSGQPVAAIVTERLPATVSLAVCSLGFALLVAFPLGVLSAVRNGSTLDHATRVFSQFG